MQEGVEIFPVRSYNNEILTYVICVTQVLVHMGSSQKLHFQVISIIIFLLKNNLNYITSNPNKYF